MFEENIGTMNFALNTGAWSSSKLLFKTKIQTKRPSVCISKNVRQYTPRVRKCTLGEACRVQRRSGRAHAASNLALVQKIVRSHIACKLSNCQKCLMPVLIFSLEVICGLEIIDIDMANTCPQIQIGLNKAGSMFILSLCDKHRRVFCWGSRRVTLIWRCRFAKALIYSNTSCVCVCVCPPSLPPVWIFNFLTLEISGI